MPVWLQVIISIVGGLGTICGIIGITAYLGERAKHRAHKKIKSEEELDDLKYQHYLQELRNIIKDENEKSVLPIKEKLQQLDDRMSKVEDGTLDTLRDRILSAYYKCRDKGYRTQYDYENVHHMFKDYLNLDGNSFVEDCMRKFDALPDEVDYKEEKKKTTKRKSSQKLLEDK